MLKGEPPTRYGDFAMKNSSVLNLKYPSQKGIVVDWDDMEKILYHSFYDELCVAPEEHPGIIHSI